MLEVQVTSCVYTPEVLKNVCNARLNYQIQIQRPAFTFAAVH